MDNFKQSSWYSKRLDLVDMVQQIVFLFTSWPKQKKKITTIVTMQKSCGFLQICVRGFRISKTKQPCVTLSHTLFQSCTKKTNNIQNKKYNCQDLGILVIETSTFSTKSSSWWTKYSRGQLTRGANGLCRGP